MGAPERKIRIVAALLVIAGLGAAGLAILSEELGVGAEAARGMFGWKRIALLVFGCVVIVVGALLLARPRIVSHVVDWEHTAPLDQSVRIAAVLIVIAGLGAAGLAILSEELGVGAEAARGMFGWKRITLLVFGCVVIAGGALLLARPRLLSTWINSRRIAIATASGSMRRWLVVAGLIAAFGLLGSFSIPWLTDWLIKGDEASDPPAPEAGSAPPPEPSPYEQFRAVVSATCERHQTELEGIAKRGYASTTSERPRLLRANASAISAAWVDLRRLDPPPELAAPYGRLLHSLRRIATAHEAAAALHNEDEAAEELHIDDVLAAASVANDAAAEIGVSACGSE